MAAPNRQSRIGLKQWGLIFLIWTLAGLFFTSQGYLFHTATSTAPFRIGEWLFREFAYSYLFALATPIIWALADRYPFDRSNWFRRLCLHLPASFVASMIVRGVHALLMNFVADSALFGDNPLLSGMRPGHPFSIISLLKFTYYTLETGALIYWVIVVVNNLLDYGNRVFVEEARSERLEKQLALAQLQALRMQLQPHFLFNTLNSISELLHEDQDRADRMIARLGDFLRMTLDDAGAAEVSLAHELEFLKCYLEIEQTRFERLKATFDIDPTTLDATVPSLILQPIAENAIRYAVTPRSGGQIRVRAERRGDDVFLSVEDDGPGLPLDERSETSLTEGLGLSNSKDRIRQLYDGRGRFELDNGRAGGTVVSMTLPYRKFEGAVVQGARRR